jgi:predicted membrane protein
MLRLYHMGSATLRHHESSHRQMMDLEATMNLAIFGGRKDVLRSVPADGEQVIALFGGAELDLSALVLPESLRLSALAMFGGVKIIVLRDTEVVFRGFALFGGQEFKRLREGPSDGPRSVIYLNAVALFGGVEVIEADS